MITSSSSAADVITAVGSTTAGLVGASWTPLMYLVGVLLGALGALGIAYAFYVAIRFTVRH